MRLALPVALAAILLPSLVQAGEVLPEGTLGSGSYHAATEALRVVAQPPAAGSASVREWCEASVDEAPARVAFGRGRPTEEIEAYCTNQDTCFSASRVKLGADCTIANHFSFKQGDEVLYEVRSTAP